MGYFAHWVPIAPWCLALGLAGGCGAGQVRVIGGNATDPGYPAPRHVAAHAHNDSTIELPSDEQIVEPDHPAAGTAQERALVHIHAPKATCSGVVVGPRLILTARQCVDRDLRAPVEVLRSDKPYRVEVASSTLTWTNREVSYVIVPDCDWQKLDVALLVLREPVPADAITPMRVATAPGPGANVQALGFGKCMGETRGLHQRVGAVVNDEPDAIVIDVPLCKGDVGGPVVERAGGDLVGVISHQDDPDDSPRRTTTIVRFDTPSTRALLAQANSVIQAGALAKQAPVACE